MVIATASSLLGMGFFILMDLVTGATGHIGNTLVRTLLDHGHKVSALVRPGRPTPALESLPVELIIGDVLDPPSLASAMYGIDVVYHLAAQISFKPGPDPETEHVNILGTRNILAAACQASIRRLVYASSIYALKMPAVGIVDESCPFNVIHARGAYDRSKAIASMAVLEAAASHLDAVLVCPTAVTGPYDFHGSETGRGIFYNISPGIKFTVDGSYDFVDVRDVARGFILAAEQGRRGQIYILGGERLTVRQVARIIWDAAGGWHLGIHLPDWITDLAAGILPILSEHPIVTPYSLAAIRSNSKISHTRASCELGYHPRPAHQTIIDTVRWWQEQSTELHPVPEPVSPAPA